MTASTRLLASIYIVMCGGGPVSGVALLGDRTWGRVVLVVISFLVIFGIPIGTALGGFGLWVLLGPDSKRPPDSPGARAPRVTPSPASLISRAEQSRVIGLAIAAAGVAALFVVMIGTGYRVTGTAGSPVGSPLYFTALGVLVLTVAAGVRHFARGDATVSTRDGVHVMTRARRKQLEAERRRGEEERRRRLERLMADPVRRSYAERIERGEPWSDAQIEYDLNTDCVATCEHLAPIERAMRAAGIHVRLQFDAKIDARCRIDADALRARFALSPGVDYAQPSPTGRGFEDPLPALIACAEHQSRIDVVHPADATTETPVFPASIAPTQGVEAARPDAGTQRFAELRTRILELARVIDAPESLIPTFRISTGNGLPHIEIDGDTYHYVLAERGEEFERMSTTSVDELLYRLFRDVAFSMAIPLARPLRRAGEDFRREMFRQQVILLARLDPQWAARCDAEHERVLEKNPFVDGA